jgi:ABC-type glycerol-3-phosphate transport system permease component
VSMRYAVSASERDRYLRPITAQVRLSGSPQVHLGPTRTIVITDQVTSQGVKWWTMAALTCAAIAPLLTIGILLKRYIVKGLTAGSVK